MENTDIPTDEEIEKYLTGVKSATGLTYYDENMSASRLHDMCFKGRRKIRHYFLDSLKKLKHVRGIDDFDKELMAKGHVVHFSIPLDLPSPPGTKGASSSEQREENPSGKKDAKPPEQKEENPSGKKGANRPDSKKAPPGTGNNEQEMYYDVEPDWKGQIVFTKESQILADALKIPFERNEVDFESYIDRYTIHLGCSAIPEASNLNEGEIRVYDHFSDAIRNPCLRLFKDAGIDITLSKSVKKLKPDVAISLDNGPVLVLCEIKRMGLSEYINDSGELKSEKPGLNSILKQVCIYLIESKVHFCFISDFKTTILIELDFPADGDTDDAAIIDQKNSPPKPASQGKQSNKRPRDYGCDPIGKRAKTEGNVSRRNAPKKGKKSDHKANKEEEPESKSIQKANKEDEDPESKSNQKANKEEEEPESKSNQEANKEEGEPESRSVQEANKDEEEPESKSNQEANKEEEKHESRKVPFKYRIIRSSDIECTLQEAFYSLVYYQYWLQQNSSDPNVKAQIEAQAAATEKLRERLSKPKDEVVAEKTEKMKATSAEYIDSIHKNIDKGRFEDSVVGNGSQWDGFDLLQGKPYTNQVYLFDFETLASLFPSFTDRLSGDKPRGKVVLKIYDIDYVEDNFDGRKYWDWEKAEYCEAVKKRYFHEVECYERIREHNSTTLASRVNIPEVYDYGCLTFCDENSYLFGGFFILMEYLENQPETARRSTFKSGYTQIKALGKLGISHNDITASNIRIVDSELFLFDFSHAECADVPADSKFDLDQLEAIEDEFFGPDETENVSYVSDVVSERPFTAETAATAPDESFELGDKLK